MAAQTMVYHSGVVNQGILISMRSRFFCLLFLFSVIANPAYPQSAGGPVQVIGNEEALTVVSTIWPLHLLVSEIIGEDGTSQALIDLNDSAHHFTLTPDDRMAIARADLLVWIDPLFEVQLAQLIASASNNRLVITATTSPDVTTRRYSNGVLDPHLWLDPDNAAAIAYAVANALAQLAPDKAMGFHERASELAAELTDLRAHVAELGSTQSKPFFVYHDAFSYLETVAGIKHAATLVNDPDAEPSMRTLLNLRRQADDLQPGCVMLEPEASADLVASVFRDQMPRKVVVDVLAHGIPAGEGAYATFINHMLVSFEECLHGG